MKRLVTVLVMVAALAMVAAGCSSKGKPADSETKKGDGGAKEKAPDSSNGSSTSDSGDSETKTPKADTAKAAKLAGDIRQGMTFDEVTAILGDPKSQFSASDNGKDVLQCVWEKDGVTSMVHFQDNKVVMVFHGTDSSAQSPVDAAQVKKNFSKVRTGMSEDEVLKLLGAPTNSSGVAGGEGQSTLTKTWEVDEVTYGVIFLNGKVQMTMKN